MYGKREAIGRACWPHHDIIVVLAGAAHFTVGDLCLDCETGHALHIAPDTPFSGVSGAVGCRLWVQHFVASPSECGQLSALANSGCFERRVEGHWLKTLREQIEAAHREGDAVALPHLVFLLLDALGTIESSVPNESRDTGEFKLRALRVGLKNEPHPLPSVDALAERLGWSRAYFSARFKASSGEGPGAYLRSLRLEHAGRLLRETRLPIKIISQRLGYADSVAFHRAFRQVKGVTPGTWRARARRVI